MKARLVARAIYLLSFIEASRIALNTIPDYKPIPFNEAEAASLFILASSIPGLLRPDLSWLFLLASIISYVATIISGAASHMIIMLGIIGSTINTLAGSWDSGRIYYNTRYKRGLASIATTVFVASGLLLFSANMFNIAVDTVSNVFTRLPGDVGEFYGLASSTMVWKVILYIVVAYIVFKVLELLVDLTTKLGRGGGLLARYDAVESMMKARNPLILMRGSQYMMLSEGFSIVATILYYPLLYTIITSGFALAGMKIEGSTSFLIPALLLPSWLIVRAFIKRSAEPEPIENLLKKPGMKSIVGYILLAALIIIGSYMAGIDLAGLTYTAVTGNPSYSDPFSPIMQGDKLGKVLESMGKILDEGGRLLIQLLWGG